MILAISCKIMWHLGKILSNAETDKKWKTVKSFLTYKYIHLSGGDASIFPKGDEDVGTPSHAKHHTYNGDTHSCKRQNPEALNAGTPVKKLCTLGKQKGELDTVLKDEQHENACKLVNESSSKAPDESNCLRKTSFIDGNDAAVMSQSSCYTDDYTSSTASRCDDGNPTKDIYRTGAKCAPGGKQDMHQPGAGFHTIGVLRTKPGRGDPTLSMSCSDKLLKWNILGCQGALLSYFLASPLFISSVVIGKCPFDMCAAERAFYRRAEQFEARFMVHKPKVLISQKEFESSKVKLESLVAAAGEGSGKLSPSSSG